MFIEFVIKRELLLKNSIKSNFILKTKVDGLTDFSLKNFRFISFSKPKVIDLNSFLSFFVLSNGSLVFVDFSLTKLNKGALLFNDLYNI